MSDDPILDEPIRWRPIYWIARRDLRMMLSGRRGAVLPALLIGTLTPMAWAPEQKLSLRVSGDVPASVLAIPGVVVLKTGGLQFRAPGPDDPDQLILRGPIPPGDRVREALDAPGELRVLEPERPLTPPGRTMALPLVAATLLTGALSESIPGERSNRTLGELLTAAVGRMEIVLGKILAWGGLASVAATLASLVYVARGGAPLGWWLLAVPLFPFANAAAAMFLVRQAPDVVGAASVALRLLPIGIGALAAAAWVLALQSPWLGAMLPVGGLLVAAGGTFASPGPVLVSMLSTLALIAAWTKACATALDQEVARAISPLDPLGWSSGLLLTGLASWIGVVGPTFWRAAGREALLDGQSVEAAAWVPALVMTSWLWIVVTRGDVPLAGVLWREPSASEGSSPNPARSWHDSIPAVEWGRALLVTLALSVSAPASGVLPLSTSPLLSEIRIAGGALLDPTWLPVGAAIGAVFAEEMFFRRWLQGHLGAVGATAVFTALISPLDPIRGVGIGLALAGIARVYGPIGSTAVRLVSAWAAGAVTVLDPAPAAFALVFAAVVATARRA